MSRRMTRRATKEVTIDPEAWRRNLRAPPDARDRQEHIRRLTNYLAFWAICPSRACERAKRCAGDAQACFDSIFPRLPERMKAQFRAELKAADAGGTPAEFARRVREEMARFDALAAGLANFSSSLLPLASPLPLAGEGGRERSERPGEGHLNGQAPSPALALLGHPLPQAGEAKARVGRVPRVRAC